MSGESAIYSGMEPGMMVCIEGTTSDESEIDQAFPFNPFYLAYTHEKHCWAILLCDPGEPSEGLRPRRIYDGDEVRIIETIEGLCGYPEEVMQSGQKSNTITACQKVIDQSSVHRIDTEGQPPVVVADYWQHSWNYQGTSVEGTLRIKFKVPIEYIMWSETNIEDIIPAALTYTREVKVTVSTNDSGGQINTNSPSYDFPEPRCVTKQLTVKQAGRY